MGLFNKFKSNMAGGVHVQVQAPGAVPANQVIPVTVNVTSDSSQTINEVKVEIKAEAKETGITMGRGQGVGVQESRTTAETVSQAENRESFTIGPGETKTVNFQLFLSGNTGSDPLGSVGGALGGVLQALGNMEHINYMYSVHAYVKVQGHTLDPSDQQSIQILPPAGAASPAPIQNLQNQNSSQSAAAQPPPNPPSSADPSNPSA